MKMYDHYDNFDQEWKWKNFTAKELSCKCCGEYFHDPESLDLIQSARELSGRKFRVNSGHRCQRHNAAVGGMPRSMHLNIAFDVSLNGHDKEGLLRSLFGGGFTTFGLYANFIHIDKREYKQWYGCSKILWGDLYNQIVQSEN